MTREIDRCRWALDTARAGRDVALVCSGDAGVYGMASPLLELAEEYPDVNVEVVPGLTAALSGGAVLGAPLAHDFCVISLSDRLTPWGGHRKAAGLRRSGRFRAGAVQSLLQGPPGLSAPGCGHPAGQRQSPGHPLRFCAEHWPGRAGKAHPAPQPAPGYRGGYVHHRLCGQRRHPRAERADGHAEGVPPMNVVVFSGTTEGRELSAGWRRWASKSPSAWPPAGAGRAGEHPRRHRPVRAAPAR